MTASLAFVGIGQLGLALIHRLVVAGVEVAAIDIRSSARGAALDEGATAAVDRLGDLPQRPGIVCACLPGQTELQAVLDDVVAMGLAAPAVVVNLSTVGPVGAAANEAVLLVAGIAYVEAPVTGGVARTRQGKSTLIVGTASASLPAAVEAMLGALGRHVVRAPSVRAAAVAKLVNNVASIAGTLALLEAFELGAVAGLEPAFLYEVCSHGTADSYVLRSTLRRTLFDRDVTTGFATRLARKDLRLAEELAVTHAVSVPLVGAAATLLDRAIAQGHSDDGFTAGATHGAAWQQSASTIGTEAP